MSFHDVVAQFLERGTAMQTFWGFYITISLGLIALFADKRRSMGLAVLASISFIAFAIVNCDGMMDIAGQRGFFYGLLDKASFPSQPPEINLTAPEIKLTPKEIAEFKCMSKPPTPGSVLTVHVLADLAVLASLWVLTLWPIRQALWSRRRVPE
jgi:hypothetical protein